MFHHIMNDLHLLDCSSPTNIYNDNCGAMDWSNSFSTNGMRHMNIQENAVREACLMNEVSTQHIPGLHNPADLFMKEFKSDSTFQTLGILLFFILLLSRLTKFLAQMGGANFKFKILEISISNLSFPRSHSVTLFSSHLGMFLLPQFLSFSLNLCCLFLVYTYTPC